MPSPRRIKVFTLIVLIGVLVTLYVTGAGRQTRSSQFYTKTQDALAQARARKESAMHDRESGLGAGGSEVGKRLKEAEDVAKRAADRKGDEFHGEHVKEKVLNDKKTKEGETKVPDVSGHYSKQDLGIEKPLKGQDGNKEQTAETEEDHKVKNELNSILKRSPIIIFSKSYCPYSKKAKHILLDLYKISPPPYVVELDEHELGQQLQAQLGQMTGRRTVPNILINGKSIGGGDDVQELHDSRKLVDKVKSMGGKRMEVSPAT
ncbi:hypothetical protein E6O75_ATG00361 [Venturia nashicola]|uniref:Glutaredoxin domain-containing protein n=1 Tax=Venturia nashicola TaxID=86259 RepID=A0A4Z1PNJ3_9PEZI|nr:hypothetical protein E6O75_ATG00361 [Venturia nashicola]